MSKRERILGGIFVALFVIGLIFIIPKSYIKGTDIETKINYDAFPFQPNSFFKRYSVPLLQVGSFVSSYKKPNDTFVDDNEGCPIGQLHNWLLKDQNIELLVLGDCYNKEVDYSASSRLYAVRKIDANASASFEDLWGIKLGDSDKLVKDKLDKFIKSYPGFDLVQDSNGSPVHGHVAGRMKHQYVLSKEGIYLFFIIDMNNRLETIMYTTIDVRAAC